MRSGEQFGSRLLPALQDGYLADIAFGLDAAVALPPVRMDHAAGGNGVEDERVQTFSRSIRNLAKADSPYTPAILLSGHYNQRFGLYQATAQTFFQAAQIALIHFNPSDQQIAPRTHHRTP